MIQFVVVLKTYYGGLFGDQWTISRSVSIAGTYSSDKLSLVLIEIHNIQYIRTRLHLARTTHYYLFSILTQPLLSGRFP